MQCNAMQRNTIQYCKHCHPTSAPLKRHSPSTLPQHTPPAHSPSTLPQHTPTAHSPSTLPQHTRCTLAEISTNKSPFVKSYLRKIDDHKYPSPLCPLFQKQTHTHTHKTLPIQLQTHAHSVVTPAFMNEPRRRDGATAWPLSKQSDVLHATGGGE